MSRTKLHVSRIPHEYPACDLGRKFEEYGTIEYCDVHSFDTYSYAFVDFHRQKDAMEAKYQLDGHLIRGHPIHVNWATIREIRDPLPDTPPPSAPCSHFEKGDGEAPSYRSAGTSDVAQAWSDPVRASTSTEADGSGIDVATRAEKEEDAIANTVIAPNATAAGDVFIRAENTIDADEMWDHVSDVPKLHALEAQRYPSGMAGVWPQEQAPRLSICGRAARHSQSLEGSLYEGLRRGRGQYHDRDAVPTDDTHRKSVSRKRERSVSESVSHTNDQQYGTQQDSKRAREEDQGW